VASPYRVLNQKWAPILRWTGDKTTSRCRGQSRAVEPQLPPRDQHDSLSIAAWLSRADRDSHDAARARRGAREGHPT
jgi:hypothetical protein